MKAGSKPMARLQDKVAIITGAAGGIGSATAHRFAQEGGRLLLVDRDAAPLDRLMAELPPGRAAAFVADVTDEASVRAMVGDAVNRFGGVDIALLNAGIEGPFGRIEEIPVADFDRAMAVNVRSVWLGLAALMPVMRQGGGGSIVVTSSVAGLRGSARLAAYSAGKHAVLGLVKSAALDGAADRIRVNAVNPAQTRTRMMESIDASARAAGRIVDPSRIPVGRYAEPAEIAAMMLFLASDDSRYCTGAAYSVDGGATA